MVVERYLKPKDMVGGLFHDHEISSLLDEKKLARWPCTSCVQKTKIRMHLSYTPHIIVKFNTHGVTASSLN
jgi:hypothetical protein